ncbi:isochorismatase family protein [Brevundimonas sp.]|uniref:isochorismatase family protein n=1 Tax=Brevundimonas sp. TaxID=1871086 RepID=UPI0017CD49F3|nr:isochorismatase family protein [Brevundimonas sp.]MBA4808898.1 isochorismatase family protein [Brevundimonas sp.]
MTQASVKAARSLLTPTDHALILIDHQSQMAFPLNSIEVGALRANTATIARAAAAFAVPTILTSVAATSFSGPVFPEIQKAFPGAPIIDRTTMNCWEDAAVIAEVNRIDKGRIVLAGLWTSVCIAGPALSAVEQGFEVYVIADASGDVSHEAHDRAMQRMIQAGVRPLTSLQYLLELQRDWARGETYDATTGIAIDHSGAYGIGLLYAKAMLGEHAREG